MLRARTIGLGMGALTLFTAAPAMAAEINSGDTAWIIVGDGPGAVHDAARPGTVLCRPGAQPGSVLSVIMQCVMASRAWRSDAVDGGWL